MEECELCGAKMKDVYVVNVDNVELRVCIKCAQGKKIISKVIEQKKSDMQQIAKKDKNEIPQLAENYGELMHNAREAMKLPMRVLAEMINEKETLLSRVEQQRTMPSVELTKKLEKALSIKLTEDIESQKENIHSHGNSEEATLGEFIKKK